MGGTALSAFFTPRFVQWFGYVPTYVIIAAALLVVAASCWLLMRDSPRWKPNTDPVAPKLAAAAKLPVTWQMSFLYAVAFGGFVAFSTYLPTYLKDVYDFDLTGAGTRTAGFAIAAVIATPDRRYGCPTGSDPPRVADGLAGRRRRHGARGRAASRPRNSPPATSFVLMALFLGLGTGGVFAWVAQRAPANGSAPSPGSSAPRRARRLLPTAGHGGDLQRGRPQLHDRASAPDDHCGRRIALHALWYQAKNSDSWIAPDRPSTSVVLSLSKG